MELTNLTKIKGNRAKAKRVGRGMGSGKGGHTTGKGTKGQKSRAGSRIPFGFEGGQVPLYKKLPTLTRFTNLNAKQIQCVSLSRFDGFKAGSTVTPVDLVKNGTLKQLPKYGVKILNSGKIDKKLTLEGFLVSQGAKEALEKAGCIIN